MSISDSTPNPENSILVENYTEENNKKERKPDGYWLIKENRKNASLIVSKRSEYESLFYGAYDVSRNIFGELDEFFPDTVKSKPSYYWTKEKCKAETVGVNSRKEFENKSESAYKVSLKYGWMNEFFPDKHVKSKDITIKDCIEKLKLCNLDRLKFANKYSTYYKVAWKNKWIEKIYKSVGIKYSKPRNYWNYERCKIESELYDNKKDFYVKSRSAYDSAILHGWLSELTKDYISFGNIFKRGVYIYEFIESKTCYIGLTCNFKQRIEGHERSGPVYDFIKKTKESYLYKELSDYIVSKEAQKLECDKINEYTDNGWNVLNTAKGGGLGGHTGDSIYTFEYCKILALKYTNKKDFRKYDSTACGVVTKNNWGEALCSHMVVKKVLNGYWNDYEKCRELIKKENYRNRTEFGKSERTAFNCCVKNNWIDEFFPITPPKEVEMFDKENNSIKIYNNINEICEDNNITYNNMRRYLNGDRKSSSGYTFKYVA